MIRRVYLDFLKDRWRSGKIPWLLSRGMQYALIQASSLAGRPFCGPVLGTVVTNYRCNYRCVMCDLPGRDAELRGQGRKELDTAAMLRIVEEFSRIGASGIGFTGGEPLLRKDIFELLARTKRMGMFSHLNTNGSLLDDGNVRSILAASVDSVNVSLDGGRAGTHDAIRGCAGAFDRAVAGIERMVQERKRQASSIRIKTVAVLQEANIDEVEDLISLARDLGVDCIEFIPRQPFRRADGGAQPVSDAFLAKAERAKERLLRWQEERLRLENSPAHLRLFGRSFRGEPSPLRCYAGYNSLAVDCFGDVYPCVPWINWRRSVGKLPEGGLREFWYSPEYRRKRADIGSCRNCYLNCQAELNLLFAPLGRA